MNKHYPAVVTLAFLHLMSCAASADGIATTGRFRAEVWADNWFALYSGDTLLKEDSISITTERSFNKEVFGFDGTYPLNLNFVLKDFKENDSGLEYIGKSNQQMGDGGFIAQIKDTTTGKYVLVSSAAWKCKVIHRAPTNTDCEKSATPTTACLSEISEEPPNWKSVDYDVSAWAPATEYTAAQVGAKDGYAEISWAANAKIIWASNLKQDNTVLCKVTVSAPE